MSIVSEQGIELSPSLLIGGMTMAALFAAGIIAGIIFVYRHVKSDGYTWRQRSEFLKTVDISSFPLRLLIAFLVLGFLFIATLAQMRSDIMFGNWGFVLQSLAFHWLVILFVAVWIYRSKKTWRDVFGLSRKSLAPSALQGLAAYLIALPLIFTAGYLYQILLITTGYVPSPQPLMEFMTGEMGTWPRFYAILVAALVAPVSEEILFRGLLLPLAARSLGVLGAVVITSALFAAMHLFIPALVPLFVVSLACSFAYIYTGSILTPIALHSIFNSINLAMFTILRDSIL